MSTWWRSWRLARKWFFDKVLNETELRAKLLPFVQQRARQLAQNAATLRLKYTELQRAWETSLPRREREAARREPGRRQASHVPALPHDGEVAVPHPARFPARHLALHRRGARRDGDPFLLFERGRPRPAKQPRDVRRHTLAIE